MTIPPRAWDVALAAVLLTAFVALIGLETDVSVVAALILAAGVLVWLTGRLVARVADVLFGSQFVARVLAFGIAVAIFPEMVVAPFAAAAALVRYLSQMTPALAASWSQFDAANPQTVAVLGKFVEGLVVVIQVPLRRIIFGFVTWVVLGHLLSLLIERNRQVGPAVASAATRVPSAVAAGFAPIQAAFRATVATFRAIPATFWPNTTVVVTLAMGIYLILGAIATIPYLSQESVPVDEMNARLTRMLDGLKRTEAQFAALHPVTLTNVDPLAQLRDFSKAPPPGDTGVLKAVVATAVVTSDGVRSDSPSSREAAATFESAISRQIFQQIAQLEQTRAGALEKWTRTRQETWTAEEKLRPALEAQFSSTVSTLRGAGEQTRYLDSIRASYSSELENIDRTLDSCRTGVQLVDDYLQSTASLTVSRVGLMRTQLESVTDSSLAAVIAGTLDIASIAPDTESFCRPYQVIFVPQLPERGAGWGPLARIFDWLLATDSLDVVVIIGMLGAGLFGSAVGTFVAASVRKKGVNIDNAPLSHLIRSFAATMVVYLGLKTGVAFAAVGNPNPDPYLMLFLCFIGTVYSDDVWKWAKRTGAAYWKPEGTELVPDKDKSTSGDHAAGGEAGHQGETPHQ
jgi:hypothetical protein